MRELEKKLINWKDKKLNRKRHVIQERLNNHILLQNTACINFSSNDYLGLVNHPDIQAAFIKGIEKYGVGSGSAAFISGYFYDQHELEAQFAAWLKVEKTILFNSGYHANIGAISTLATRHDIILSDKLCHASLLDGIQLSRAKHYRYEHNSLSDLTRLAQLAKPQFIVTESIFSMEGDIISLLDILTIAKLNQSETIIDDAHGIGILGEEGRGIIEAQSIPSHEISCLIAPLGKAFGAMGAMVGGKRDLIEFILQFSRTYRYTTALPPAMCTGLLKTLAIIINEKWRRQILWENIHFFNQSAKKRNLLLSSYETTPIRSILIGDNNKTVQLQEKLLQRGFFVSCIRPPTVPNQTSRIRISLNSLHTTEQITQLLDHIQELLAC